MWWNSRLGCCGDGILSLISHVLGWDTVDAIRWAANQLDIPLERRDAWQASLPKYMEFIPTPLAYGFCAPPPHPWLGVPRRSYCFRTENGVPTFWLEEWGQEASKVRLFATLGMHKATRQLFLKFAMPPTKSIFFNLDQIVQRSDAMVYIFDDISSADQFVATSTEVATWAGEKGFAADINWEILSDRRVVYVYAPSNRVSVEIGGILLNCFKKMGMELLLEAHDVV